MSFETFKSYKINKIKLVPALLISITCALYFVYSFKKYDIISNDDYVYMNTGYYLHFPLTNNYLGFFYPLFFKIMFFLTGFKNILTNVYLTYYLLSIGNFIGIYLYLKSIGVKSQISFFIPLLFLFSDYQILLFPKISFFCLLLIIFTFKFIQDKERFNQLFALTILCWVLGYTRPEFFFSYILSSITLLIIFILDKKYTSKYNYLKLVFPLVLLAFGVFFLNGQPVTHRGLDAFKQHFIINYLSWHPEIVLSNEPRSEFTLFRKVYGGVESMFGIFSTNSGLFIKHISYNILNYAKLTSSLLYNITSASLVFVFQTKTKYFILLGMISLLLFIDIKASLNTFNSLFISFLKKNALIITLVLFPTLVSVVLIYPREHYFLFHLIIYFSFIGIALTSIVFKQSAFHKFAFISIIGIWTLGYTLKYNSTINQPKTLALYEYILKKSENQKVVLISNEPFSTIFFKEKLNRYFSNPFLKKDNENIGTFIKQHDINFIYLDEKSRDLSNNNLTQFINHDYMDYGFKKITSYQDINYLIFVK